MLNAVRSIGPLLAVLAAVSLAGCDSKSSPATSGPAIVLAPASLSFAATVSGADPAPQAVTVSNGGSGALAVPTATIAYTTGSGWLTATVSGAAQPYTVAVQPATGSLTAGNYQATVSVASPGASNTPRTFAVTFTVTGGTEPAIGLSPTSLTFVAESGGAVPPGQTVTVSNLGGGTLAAPTTSISYASGTDWLTATVSGAAAPYAVAVRPATTGLAPGTYAATVSVASAGATNTPQTFGVSFTVSAPPAIGLSPVFLSFTAIAGGADPAAKVVTVSNSGGGTLAAPTTSITYTSGTGWLTATASGAAAPYTITVQPSVAGLVQGTYEATVSVASPGAANTPQTFGVSLVVSSAAPPTISLSDTSLSFAAILGGANPPQQTVTVTNAGGSTLATPTTSIAYGSGAGWLSANVSGTAAPYAITVQPATGTLAVGTYDATVSVASAGATNTPQAFPVSFTVVAAPPPCLDAGAGCATGGECCSAICKDDPLTPAVDGICTTDAFCAAGGAPCVSDADCCSVSCTNAGTPGATCAAMPCDTVGTACSDGSTCCSGVCDVGGTNTCLALPGGTCTTLGERCAGPLECCSKNCQGANATTGTYGWCAPAYTCNAPGDVCWRIEDCCSGLCSATGGAPGRCQDASGGCTQDGVPCDNDANCCTRLCVDLGSGTKVCQPAPGCRMTGDYCDSTDACCNINQIVPPSQAVQCLADHTCDNGGACNPPGNICGASTDVNASQNCCNGKKDVCKPDSNGILRCFGGQTPSCPTGWDSDDPNCCIPPGSGPESICQFRDQCCNMAPCVPDATGVLHCALPETCLPRGSACDPANDRCCTGTTCDAELGCIEPPGTCLPGDAPCTIPPPSPAETCCSGVCYPSTPGGTTGTCATCAPTGSGCTSDAQCCSGSCDLATGCRAPCVGDAGACTVDADCCAGLACNIPPGDTSGTCGTAGSTCAGTGQTCGVDTDCCNFATGETCVAGACTPPSTCSSAAQSCTFGGGECCAGLACLETVPDPSNPPDGTMTVDCTATGTCFCDVAACVPQASDCTNNLPCCAGSTCTVTGYPLFPCPDPPDPEQPCTCTASP